MKTLIDPEHGSVFVVLRTMHFLEFFVAARYLRGQARTILFNLGTRLSFLFMTLMVFTMVLVLSIFGGFQQQVQNSLWNSGYHITIHRKPSRATMKDYGNIAAGLKQNDQAVDGKRRQFADAFGSISVNGLLEWRNRFVGKLVRAIPVDEKDLATGNLANFPRLVHFDRKYMRDFNKKDYIIVGREVARHYGWRLGDSLTLNMPRGGVLSKNLSISRRSFTIAGFFKTGYYEYDLNIFFLSLQTAQRVLSLRGRATEVIVQLNDVSRLEDAKKLVMANLPDNGRDYALSTLRDKRGNFLAALQLEKTMMSIIMGLLVLLGAAGIWVTTNLQIKSKRRSIGMLRALGMPTSSVVVIFTAFSMLVGVLATAVGGSLGIFAAEHLETIIELFEDLINGMCHFLGGACGPVQLFPRDIYYFDKLPVNIDIYLIFAIAMQAMVLSGIAGYAPALKAATADPVRAIRNE